MCMLREEEVVEKKWGRSMGKKKGDEGTCSLVLSDLLRTSEHAQFSLRAPHVTKSIPGVLLSMATYTLTHSEKR